MRSCRLPLRRSLLLLLLLLLITTSTSSDEQQEQKVEWEILTKLNFSSHVRLHPHVLLFLTVPWCGESRSLMKELAQAVTEEHGNFSSLRLMLVYKNKDRMLADALGAAFDGITIIYYHHSFSFKYKGKRQVHNVLSSIDYVMSLKPEEIPIKSLSTTDDLHLFLNSTDKALLLLEFCGWTQKLLADVKNNATKDAIGGFLGSAFNGETNNATLAAAKKNKKKAENEKMNCDVGNVFSGIPWLDEFTPWNESEYLEAENLRLNDRFSCSFEEFQEFQSFLPQFVTTVREFFLPPERLRFGLVSDSSLLSSLGVMDSGPWLMLLYFAGCPGCSRVIREVNDLNNVLGINDSPVAELKSDKNDLEVPPDRPSVLLFIDRSSDSLNVRRESQEVLDVFREFALRNYIPHQMGVEDSTKPPKSSSKALASKTISERLRLERSSLSQKITAIKDKMSIMITNDGKHVTVDNVVSDYQGSSFHDILAYVLQQKKEIKLSSLAKNVGFRLLSDDFGIKIEETHPPLEETQVSAEPFKEVTIEHSSDAVKDQVPKLAGISARELHKLPGEIDAIDTEHVFVKSVYDEQLGSHAADGMLKEKTLSEFKMGVQPVHTSVFNGSFFFLDGQYRLVEALTAVSNTPSVVLIDPPSGQHFVLPQKAAFSYSLLSDFIHGFLNGTLRPYHRSETASLKLRESLRPPFVNIDFHEVDSVPRITSGTFSELVIGNQSDHEHATNAWKRDVLVLFCSSWCGFCQRTELVVHEVYRAFKYYGSKKSSDDMADIMLKLPAVYVMDCTGNDCSIILKSRTEREVYPSLLLFPAENKKTVSYEGAISVSNIIKFIADYGSGSRWLLRKSDIWAGAEVWNDKVFNDASVHAEASLPKGKRNEILLKARTEKVLVKNKIKPSSGRQYDSYLGSHQVSIGSILIATDRLVNVYPFEESNVLIIKADQSTGFQGLIVNKHISWDTFQELEEGLEPLKDSPLSLGGPIMMRGKPLVSLTKTSANDRYLEVLPGVYFLDQSATLDVIEGIKSRSSSVADYWFFLGYSSWGWDQLFDEIIEGAWNVSNRDVEQLVWPLT